MFSNLDKMVRHMDIAQAQMDHMNFLLAAILCVLCGILGSDALVVAPLTYRRWRQSRYPKTIACLCLVISAAVVYVLRAELLVAAWMVWQKMA